MRKIQIKAKDGATINVIVYDTEQTAKGVVIICYGFGEHAEMYTELAEHLECSGYASILFDQRGHGAPPDDKKNWFGIIRNYQDFLDDIDTVTDEAEKLLPGIPIAIYGHSMGGNIAANALLRNRNGVDSGGGGGKSRYACAVFESPWLGLSNGPSAFLTTFIRLASHIIPNMTITNKLVVSDISGDPSREESYTADPLYHNTISFRLFTGINNGCKFALANASRFPVPLYLAYAVKERSVNNKAILQFAADAGDKVTLREYESCHAIHNDVKREELFSNMIAYLDANCA
jgi:lysophospholipase